MQKGEEDEKVCNSSAPGKYQCAFRIFLFTDIIIYGFDVPGLTHIKLSQKLNLESTVAESVPDNRVCL